MSSRPQPSAAPLGALSRSSSVKSSRPSAARRQPSADFPSFALLHQSINPAIATAHVELALGILSERDNVAESAPEPLVRIAEPAIGVAEAADPAGAVVRVKVLARDFGHRVTAVDEAADDRAGAVVVAIGEHRLLEP